MTIAFAPGFMTDETLWDDCVEGFERFAPIRHVDMSKDASIEAIASRALGELPARFILVGFSFGGYVVREMTRQAANVAQIRFSGLSRSTIEMSLHPEHINEATVERIRAMGARLGGDVFQRLSAVRRTGDIQKLQDIRCPTLVVAARKDRLRSLEEAQELSDGIPHAELSIIEGSGHMIPIEAPQALVAAVAEWLQKQGF